MTFLLAGAAGIAAAVLGWLVTGAAAAWIAGVVGMRVFEGARGMFAFLGVGPIGGLVCMVAAVWLVLRGRHGAAPLGATLGRVTLVLAGIAGVAAAGVVLRLQTIDTYTDALPPQLVFEVRLPARMAVADRATIDVELHTDRNTADAVFLDPWSRLEDDGQVIAGVLELAMKTSSRVVVVSLPDGSERLFRLPLSRDPRSTPALGEWRRADHLARKGEADVVAAPKDDPVALRWRVRRAGEE